MAHLQLKREEQRTMWRSRSTATASSLWTCEMTVSWVTAWPISEMTSVVASLSCLLRKDCGKKGVSSWLSLNKVDVNDSVGAP